MKTRRNLDTKKSGREIRTKAFKGFLRKKGIEFEERNKYIVHFYLGDDKYTFGGSYSHSGEVKKGNTTICDTFKAYRLIKSPSDKVTRGKREVSWEELAKTDKSYVEWMANKSNNPFLTSMLLGLLPEEEEEYKAVTEDPIYIRMKEEVKEGGVNFGKYKHIPIEEVIKKDLSYIKWVISSKTVLSLYIKEAIREELDRLGIDY